MDDPVAFLCARLDEDEARAKRVQAALDAGWNYFDEVPAELIDPARVLREVAAKRAILRTYEELANPRTQEEAEIRRTLSTDVLPALTAVYSDHPDYRSERRP